MLTQQWGDLRHTGVWFPGEEIYLLVVLPVTSSCMDHQRTFKELGQKISLWIHHRPQEMRGWDVPCLVILE